MKRIISILSLVLVFGLLPSNAQVKCKTFCSDKSAVKGKSKVQLKLTTPSNGDISLDKVKLSDFDNIKNAEQYIQAAKNMKFALQEKGFTIVDKTSDADVVFILSLNDIEIDFLYGYPASKLAFINIVDATTNKNLVNIKVKGAITTFNVNNMPSKVARELYELFEL